MIFITVGTQKFQFDRIFKMIDALVAQGIVLRKVFAQIGYSDYVPNSFEYERFLEQEEFARKIEQCDLLITHSGVASIMAGLRANKPVIVVPRLAKYGEHVDDHQIQIAEAFSQQKVVLMCGENDNLLEKIESAKTYEFAKYEAQQVQMVQVIREYLETL